MRKTRRIFAALLALVLLCGAGLAEMVFDGVVTGGDAQYVLAPFGGVMDEVNVRVGDRVQRGQTLLLLHANDEARVGPALELAAGAVRLAPEAPQPRPLLFGAVE